MTELYDFSKYPENNRDYGGNSGLKLGVDIDGTSWMIKFPKSMAGFRNADMSYSTSPLSEYIGSKVYESLNIPVHETRLGVYNGKVVVACKNMVPSGGQLIEFNELKNRYSPGLEEYFSSSSSGRTDAHGYLLETIEVMFALNPALSQVSGLEEHFWDMFIVDAFIGNNDRNNGNWGIIKTGETVTIAPVYDNGNSFRNKASDRQLLKTLRNEEAIKDSAYRIQTCYFEGEDGRQINPNEYISAAQNPKCNEALKRIVPEIDFSKIQAIINDIPVRWNGYDIISDIRKEYYLKLMEYRYRDILLPVWQKINA